MDTFLVLYQAIITREIAELENIQNLFFMKKSIAIVLFVFLSVTSFAGIKEGRTDDGGRNKKTTAEAKSKKAKRKARALAMAALEEDPIESLSPSSVGVTDSEMTVKVFNKKGELLLEKKVRIEKMLNQRSIAQELPQHSFFVMYHGGTAYYFIDKES